MSLPSLLRSIDSVAAHLPFQLDDLGRLNQVFASWHAGRDPANKRIIDIWVYCFTRRYFTIKFLRDPSLGVTDLDLLVDRAYARVQEHMEEIRHPELFTHWVSVICKHTFLNYARLRRVAYALDDARAAGVVAEAAEHPAGDLQHDRGAVYQALLAAIERLPLFLREVARLRFLENLSYEEIGARTGRPAPTIRSYVHKVLDHLRRDPGLNALLREVQG